MKRYLIYILSATILFSCDVVEKPVDKYELCDITDLDPSFNDTVFSTSHLGSKVLLEDYTGHQCGNCPSASVKADEMAAKHGDNIVLVAVHAGFFAEVKSDGKKYRTDFRVAAGETYFEDFNIITNPNGLINRKPFGGKTVLGINQWDAAIQDALTAEKQADLNMQSIYNSDRRIAFVNTEVEFKTDVSESLSLVLMVTENNIIDWQKNYVAGGDPAYSSPDESSYVHKHVLRMVGDNKTWGDVVNSGTISAGEKVNVEYQICVDETWNASECYAVAVLYDKESKEVVEVEEIHLTNQ